MDAIAQTEAYVETEAAPMPIDGETPKTPGRKQGRVSIEGVCEDPERFTTWFEFENSWESLSPHVTHKWVVPPTIKMEEKMNKAAEPVAFIVQADKVHLNAAQEIFEVEGKIAALEA